MYIIKVFDQYFLKDDGDYVIETHSPILATDFKTKKEAKDYVAKNTEWKEYATIVKRTQKMVDEFNAWLSTMQRRRIEKIDRSGKYDFNQSKHGRDEVFDFWMNKHSKPGAMSDESFLTWPYLSAYFKNLYSVGRTGDNQYYVECWFRVGDDYNTFEKEMVYLFDHVTVDELKISVFDHFLCEGGNKVDFTINRSLSEVTVEERFNKKSFKSLKECFDFMVKERYYE